EWIGPIPPKPSASIWEQKEFSCFKKILNLDHRFPQYRPQGSFRHFPRMMRDCHFSPRHIMPPNLMTARRMPIKRKTQRSQLPHDLAVFEPGKPAHQFTLTG